MPRSETLHICLFGDERSIHVRRWVLALRDMGNKVGLITLKKDHSNDIGGIGLGARTRLSYLSRLPLLRSLVRKINPTILHSQYASSFGFLASIIDHPRKIVSVWGDDIIIFLYKNFMNKAVVKRSLNKADRLTSTSGYLKESALRLITPQAEISVIPFGIDLDSRCFVQRSPRPVTRIGIIKWLIPKYGIDILIRAFDIVLKAGHDAEFVVAGRGGHEDEYRRLASSLGLDDKVIFHGYIDHDKIQDLLASLDFYAMPSISDGESSGVAALEASATGLPVVASRVAGGPEVVTAGVIGLLVERSHLRQLADAPIRLIDNPDLRAKMGLAGRKQVEQRYRWQGNVRSMQNLYLEIAR